MTYRVSGIVLGLEDGDLEADLDLEREFLPEGGYRLSGAAGENGVQRIARQLSEAERAVKEQLEGHESDEAQPAPKPPARTKGTMKRQFQVISGEFFSHTFEPTLTVYGKKLTFNRTCVESLSRSRGNYNSETDAVYTEILLNPIERMLAVRPCAKDHPNAVKWSDSKQKSCSFGASVFCGMLFEMQDWSEDCSYRIPASIRTKDGETVLFFDLDNATVKRKRSAEELREKLSEVKNGDTVITGDSEAAETGETETHKSETGSFFFGAEDEEDEKELSTEENEEIQRRLLELIALDKVTFGTPFAEHTDGSRLSTIDSSGLWNVTARARALGEDHRVDSDIVRELEERLLERGTT